MTDHYIPFQGKGQKMETRRKLCTDCPKIESYLFHQNGNFLFNVFKNCPLFKMHPVNFFPHPGAEYPFFVSQCNKNPQNCREESKSKLIIDLLWF